MFDVSLTGADQLTARFDGLPSVVLAAIAAQSAALAAQLLARLGDGAFRIDGPTIAGDRVVTTLLGGGDQKDAAIRAHGGAGRVQDILPARARALAAMAGGEAAIAKLTRRPGPADPDPRAALGEMAAQITADLKAAALDAARKQMGA